MLVAEQGYIYDLLIKLGLTPFGARTGEFLLVRPLQILLIVLIAVVSARLVGRAIRRSMRTVQARSALAGGSVRAAQRATTLGDVLASAAKMVIYGIAALMVLSQVGVNLGPLLAGAGIAGIAVGFGAQSLVRDFLSGFFIIVEDQYGVGDVIDIGDTTGTVEELSMRVTRVRAVDGTVWFIPNGEIKQVGNTSMEWSRALIDVLIAYDNDIDRAVEIITDEARRFAADPDWDDKVLEPPEVWGVQAMGQEGVTIRLVVKTAPRQQYVVARELRGRITGRLRREGIKGPGQMVVVTSGALDEPPPPSADGT